MKWAGTLSGTAKGHISNGTSAHGASPRSDVKTRPTRGGTSNAGSAAAAARQIPPPRSFATIAPSHVAPSRVACRGRRGRRRTLHLRPVVFLRLPGRAVVVAGVALGAPKSPPPGVAPMAPKGEAEGAAGVAPKPPPAAPNSPPAAGAGA